MTCTDTRSGKWLLRAFFTTLLLGLAACASTAGRAPAVQSSELLVGSDLDNAPFAWLDEDGVARGRDVEMMLLVAEILGRELVWERMPFDELLDAAAAGEVDVVCATLGITPERAERVAFSPPYFETVQAVVVRSGPGEPRSLDDLAGRAVGAPRGTTSERAVVRRLPRSRLDLGAKGQSARERLLTGEVDAMVMDGPAADALVAAAPGGLVRLGEALAAENYALAIPVFAGEDITALSRAISSLRRAGVLDQLDRRFGLR